MAATVQTPWFRIGAFFFAIGAGYEFLIIKAGYYDIMKRSEARKRLETKGEREQWFKEWEKQGIVIGTRNRVSESSKKNDDHDDQQQS